MLQVLPYQQRNINIGVLGKYHLPEGTKGFSFIECIGELSKPLTASSHRIFHARRNNEMIQAIVLKYVFFTKIKIVFTATAQRNPSWITRWLISKADGLLTTSRIAAAYLPRSPDKIICHGVDTLRFRPPSQSKKEAWKSLNLPGQYGIGIFGRVRPQKGTDLLIDAMIKIFKMHPECAATVVVVGETTKKYETYLNSLKEQIRARGLDRKFIFLGKQSFEKIPELFRGMKIVAALSRNEGFGLTVLEAMASGCAVIATEAGAWPEIVKNDFGRIVPKDNLELTIQTLEELLALPSSTINKMGQRARLEIEKNYLIEQEAKQIVDFYRSLQNNSSK